MRHSFHLIIVLVLLSVASSVAQDKISVESTVDHQEITIGDLVLYQVTITADTALTVDSLTVGSNLGMFEIKDYIPQEIKVYDQFKVISEGFLITTFTTGDYQIPSLTINYRSKNGQLKSITTDPLTIKVKSLLTGEEGEDIKPLKGLRSFERGFPWWIVAIVAFLLAAIALFVYRYRKARAPIELEYKKIDTRLPWEIALAELGELKDSDMLATDQFKEYYLRLSEIFRCYLQRRYGIIALERTTFEIIAEFRQLGIGDEEENSIERFLDGCDLVKFAKFWPSEELACTDHDIAREFVLRTRSLPHSLEKERV